MEPLEISGEALCRLSSVLGQMLVLLEQGRAPATRAMGGIFGELDREAERLQLRSVSLHLERLKEAFLSGTATATSMHPMVLELYNRMRDAFEERILVAIDPNQVELYRPKSPLFGPTVALNFPSIAYDIEEAGKCLALGRGTAAAFHAIRCLESAVRAVSRCLGIPDPTKAAGRNWGSMLKCVKDEIDRRWPASTNRLSGDGHTFDEVYAALTGIQNPWRNATMHLDHRYTLEEARHIFDIVGGLMKRVASRCDENGKPTV